MPTVSPATPPTSAATVGSANSTASTLMKPNYSRFSYGVAEPTNCSLSCESGAIV